MTVEFTPPKDPDELPLLGRSLRCGRSWFEGIWSWSLDDGWTGLPLFCDREGWLDCGGNELKLWRDWSDVGLEGPSSLGRNWRSEPGFTGDGRLIDCGLERLPCWTSCGGPRFIGAAIKLFFWLWSSFDPLTGPWYICWYRLSEFGETDEGFCLWGGELSSLELG